MLPPTAMKEARCRPSGTGWTCGQATKVALFRGRFLDLFSLGKKLEKDAKTSTNLDQRVGNFRRRYQVAIVTKMIKNGLSCRKATQIVGVLFVDFVMSKETNPGTAPRIDTAIATWVCSSKQVLVEFFNQLGLP